MKRRLLIVLAITTLISALIVPAMATEPVKQQMLVDQARIIFQSFMIDENMAWFRDHMHEAKGFLIIPEVAAFLSAVQGEGACWL
ncbi:MAG: hypothetical protein R6W88_09660 [Desulfobacterales bacterium]